MRTQTIQPAATKEERLRQYVAALLEYDGEVARHGAGTLKTRPDAAWQPVAARIDRETER